MMGIEPIQSALMPGRKWWLQGVAAMWRFMRRCPYWKEFRSTSLFTPENS